MYELRIKQIIPSLCKDTEEGSINSEVSSYLFEVTQHQAAKLAIIC